MKTPSYPSAVLSDPGCIRELNEDTCMVDADLGFALLCDGMGGHNAGEVASRLAIDAVAAALRTLLEQPDLADDRLASRLSEAICDTNRLLRAEAERREECRDMGTTLAGLVLRGDRALVLHLGDSRAYRLRHEVCSRLTRDHSLLEEQLASGVITLAKSRTSKLKNIVTRGLGVEAEVEPELQWIACEADDLFLLCSDGLSDMVEDADIESLMRANLRQPGRLATQLVEAAKEAGGRDNVTVVLLGATRSARAR
jgi:serine/threonine protein phosphatase PrpC